MVAKDWRALAPLAHTSWAVAPYSWRAATSLARELDLPLVAAMVLAGRGFTEPGDAYIFLTCSAPIPDPFLFGHMEATVRAISQAIDQGRRVVVHGDYDADGITATAVMVLGLRELGVDAEWYLPSRFNEGYGLSRTAVEAIAAGGPALLLTVDCGVNYPAEVALARDRGLDVVVIDHHQPGPVLPDCQLIHAAVGRYPHNDLCGVGLALKVMHALHIDRRSASRDALPGELTEVLDLVAIGTIADLAPLRGENRYYVKEGLKLIGIGSRPGVRALAAVAGCTGGVDSGVVAYRLAPRLNAAGRLADASPPLRLLLTDDDTEAAEIAARLHELNGARQDVERQILDEAVTQVESLSSLPPALVLAGEDWHEGVVGIVAARLVERYHRPTILLGLRDEVAKGSGRSIAAYDLMGSLDACAELLTVYGGHTQAVGLTLEAGRVDDLRRAVEEHAGGILRAADLLPVYRADAVLRGEDINADTARALASLGPFGSDNPRPRLLVVGAGIERAETTRTGSHLRCVVEVDGVRARAIGFGMGEAATSLHDDGDGRLLGVQLRVDEWQGTLRPEFLLERVGRSKDDEPTPCKCSPRCSRWSAEGPTVPDMDSVVRSSCECSTAAIPAARDLRDRSGRLGAIVQTLGTGERTVILTCSVPQALEGVLSRASLAEVVEGDVECAGRGCWASSEDRVSAADVAIVEWDVAARAPVFLGARAHIIAVDPPYRAAHVALLHRAAGEGANVHLYYGAEERQATARLLRYLVHPRFAMVCLYRATREGIEGEGLLARAAEIGWEEAGITLDPAQLLRAQSILKELGIDPVGPGSGRPGVGEARIDAQGIAAYAAAEADYEECSRLCRIL